MLCASFSPGGMFLATGCADHHVRVYAMFGQEGPERILELEAHGDRVDSIQWANSGLRFISGSKDGTAIMWRYEKQEWRTTRLRMTTRLEGSAAALNTESLSELGQKLKVTMVTWSRNDRWLITAVSDFSIKVWDSTNGKTIQNHFQNLICINYYILKQEFYIKNCGLTKEKLLYLSLIRTIPTSC